MCEAREAAAVAGERGREPGTRAGRDAIGADRDRRREEVVVARVRERQARHSAGRHDRVGRGPIRRGIEVALTGVRAVAGDPELHIAAVDGVDRVLHLEAVIGRDRDGVGHDPGVLDHPTGVDREGLEQVDPRHQVEHALWHVHGDGIDLALVEAHRPRVVAPSHEPHHRPRARARDRILVDRPLARETRLVVERGGSGHVPRDDELVAETAGRHEGDPRIGVALATIDDLDRHHPTQLVEHGHRLRSRARRIDDHHLGGQLVPCAGRRHSDRFDLVARPAAGHCAHHGRRDRLHVVDHDAVARHVGDAVEREVVEVVALAAAEQQAVHVASGPAGVARPRVLDGEAVRLGRAANLRGPAHVEREHVLLTRRGLAVGAGGKNPVEQELDRRGDLREVEQVLQGRGSQGGRVETVILGHHDRGGAAGPGRDRVVALARLDPHDPGAAGERVVADTAEEVDQAGPDHGDGVVAVLSLEPALGRGMARAQGQRVVAVATLEGHGQPVQARGVERIVADAALEEHPLHARVGADVRPRVVQVFDVDRSRP